MRFAQCKLGVGFSFPRRGSILKYMTDILSWRARRQLAAVLAVVFVIGGAAFWYGRRFLPNPTCFDNRRNDGEVGIDCGGPCAPCELKNPRPLSVFWARAARAGADAYDAVALVENPNEALSSADVRYEFTLLDELGVIGRKTGATYIYAEERRYIIEPGVATSREPIRVEFVILGAEWQTRRLETPALVTEKRTYAVEEQDGNKQGVAEAQIFNGGALDLGEVEVDFIVFDEAGNMIGANKVSVENLSAGERKPVKSIWPEPLAGTIGKIEVYPRVNLFDPGAIIKPQ